eukprot:3126545-Pyramimonas_sp.AAC.1
MKENSSQAGGRYSSVPSCRCASNSPAHANATSRLQSGPARENLSPGTREAKEPPSQNSSAARCWMSLSSNPRNQPHKALVFVHPGRARIDPGAVGVSDALLPKMVFWLQLAPKPTTAGIHFSQKGPRPQKLETIVQHLASLVLTQGWSSSMHDTLHACPPYKRVN